MELEDVCSDLLALIKLYGLLQSSEDNRLNAGHVNLDGNTKLFLKKLLDCALEKVFGTHSKIIAAQANLSDKPCCTPPIQPEATMKLHSPALTNPIIDSNTLTIISSKEEQSVDKLMPEEKVSVAHILPAKPKNTKKRCRSCQLRSIKQRNLTRTIKATNENNPICNNNGNYGLKQAHDQLAIGCANGVVPNSNLVDLAENKCDANSAKLLDSSFHLGVGNAKPSSEQNRIVEIDQKLEVVDYLSEEINEAIKQIKSRLQGLRPAAKDVEPLEESNVTSMVKSHRQDLGPAAKDVEPPEENNVKSMVHQPIENEEGIVTRLKHSPVNNVHQNQSRKPFPEASSALKIQAASQHPSRNDSDQLSKFGNEKDGNSATATYPCTSQKPVLNPIGEGSDYPNIGHTNNVKAMVEKIESLNRLKSENDHFPSQTHKYVRVLRVSQVQESTLQTELPVQINELHIEQDIMPQNKISGILRTIAPPLRAQSLELQDSMLPNRKVEEVNAQPKMNSTLLNCNSSKIMVNPLYEDHVMEDHTRRGARKNIRFKPQRKIIARQQISEETSSSYGSSSSTNQQRSSSYSGSDSDGESQSESVSQSESYSSGKSSSSAQSRRSNYKKTRYSRLVHPKKDYKSEGQMIPVKQFGRMRKLKNKLGLIFHHHHHHHHNLNNDDTDDDDFIDHTEAAHAISLWTNMRKIFHRTNQNKVHDDHHPFVNSRRKAMVKGTTTKNEHGHFPSLVEGLMKHIRHTKKSQPSKVGIRQHGRDKKVMKKIHWWQMLKRKRGGKLPNKGRVKLGYGSKKSRLRAPKIR